MATDDERAKWDRLHAKGYEGFYGQSGHGQGLAIPFNPEKHPRMSAFLDVVRPDLFSPNTSVLEIGCGGGTVMDGLYKKVARCVGFDISEGAVSVARKRYEGIPNVEFHVAKGDGTFPAAIDGMKFTFVYCVSVIQHIPRAVAKMYMENVSRYVDDDGVFLFQIISRMDESRNHYDIDPDCGHEETIGYSVKDFMELAVSTGLELVSVTRVSRLPERGTLDYVIVLRKVGR